MSNELIVQILLSGKNDLIWFESHLNELISKYNNKFIAIHNETVIEADSDLDVLIKKLKK